MDCTRCADVLKCMEDNSLHCCKRSRKLFLFYLVRIRFLRQDRVCAWLLCNRVSLGNIRDVVGVVIDHFVPIVNDWLFSLCNLINCLYLRYIPGRNDFKIQYLIGRSKVVLQITIGIVTWRLTKIFCQSTHMRHMMKKYPYIAKTLILALVLLWLASLIFIEGWHNRSNDDLNEPIEWHRIL